MTQLKARPLEWHKSDRIPEWTDDRMGFHIGLHDDLPANRQYVAAWGEGDAEHFATLDDAKEWCQEQADAWVRENAVVV